MNAISFLNVGIYSIPQASRLTRIPAPRVRRWLKGYHFNTTGGVGARVSNRRDIDPGVAFFIRGGHNDRTGADLVAFFGAGDMLIMHR